MKEFELINNLEFIIKEFKDDSDSMDIVAEIKTLLKEFNEKNN